MADANPKTNSAHSFTDLARQLAILLHPERGDIALVVLFSTVVGILVLATPITVQALVNFVSFGGVLQPLIVLGVLLFGLLVLAGGIRVLQTYVVELLQRRLFVRVVADLADRLPRVTLDHFYQSNGPERVNRFFDLIIVQKITATLLLSGISLLLQALVGLLILAFYHPFLLAFDAVLVALIAVVLFVGGRGAVRTAVQESKVKYAIAGALEETARHPLIFKLAGTSAYARDRLNGMAIKYLTARRSHFGIVLRQVVGFMLLQAIAATALLTLGGWLVMDGQLTLGQLVAAELILSAVLASFSKMSIKLESIYDLFAAAAKLDEMLDLPLEREGGASLAGTNFNAGLQVKRLSFNFPGGPPILKDLSFSIAPGRNLTIEGGSASGKSTLAEIILGMRTPVSGRVELGGMDIREMSLAALREHVMCVRDCEIIEASVEENVRMGRASVSDSDVRAALDQVDLLREVRDWPDGLATVLSFAGAPMSTGQARRLMIARALAGRPRVLILDSILDEIDDAIRARLETSLTSWNPDMAMLILTRRRATAGEDRSVLRIGGTRAEDEIETDKRDE